MPSNTTSPPQPNGRKTPNGTAHVEDLDNVELKEMPSAQPSLPVEEDIMQLARLGEVAAIQKLFDSGKFDATYSDEQGITPLHWAAINNHYALCHFLIQSGANVNAKGGDAVATPVLWAAKRCNYYIVNLLLQHGADPLMTDDQGFNLLHSATLDGNVFQLVLLLHQDIPVDIPDAQGHTSLMWAAYKGYPSCVDLFLRWGANVYARDDQGFTALHWALVKGSQPCIQKLLEYGSDRFAENNDGKTPSITAEEMSTVKQWQKSLSDCGYNKDGSPRYFPLAAIVKDRRMFLTRFYFIWPFLIIFCGLYILSALPLVLGVPIAAFVCWLLQWLAQQALIWAPSDMKHVHKTPFLAGIFAGSLFWVGLRYITHVMPWTLRTNPLSNILFVIFYGFCTYFYIMAMIEDPGYIPKPGSRTSQKAIINELIEARRFDESNFCVHCMVRKPLRSKHCKRCSRCVAKTDHHCPWVNNCVAVNNHRHFILYILFMAMGIITFFNLVLAYMTNIPDPTTPPKCAVITPELCTILNKDAFTIVLTVWIGLQLIWVTMLIIVQLLQVARGLTTYEAMRGYSHPRPTTGDAITSFITTGTTSPDAGAITSSGAGPTATSPSQSLSQSPSQSQSQSHAHPHKHHGCWDTWKRLLGLDTFLATAIYGSGSGSRSRRGGAQAEAGNPFSRGVLTNCQDFWCDPGPLLRARENGVAMFGGERVDYTRLYDVPPRMRMRRGGGEEYQAVGTEEV